MTAQSLVFVLAVSLQVCLIAYAFEPRIKALLASVPVPFTAAVLCTGQRIDVTHAAGMLLVFGFIHLVIYLHGRRKWPVAAADICAVLLYCLAGYTMNALLLKTTAAFAAGLAVSALIAAWVLLKSSARSETGHKSPLPVLVKFPLIFIMVLTMFLVRDQFSGFMATFPYVTVFAVYENRKSLQTFARQFLRMVIAFDAMIALVFFLQDGMSMAPALGAGWAVFLAVLLALQRGRLVPRP